MSSRSRSRYRGAWSYGPAGCQANYRRIRIRLRVTVTMTGSVSATAWRSRSSASPSVCWSTVSSTNRTIAPCRNLLTEANSPKILVGRNRHAIILQRQRKEPLVSCLGVDVHGDGTSCLSRMEKTRGNVMRCGRPTGISRRLPCDPFADLFTGYGAVAYAKQAGYRPAPEKDILGTVVPASHRPPACQGHVRRRSASVMGSLRSVSISEGCEGGMRHVPAAPGSARGPPLSGCTMILN